MHKLHSINDNRQLTTDINCRPRGGVCRLCLTEKVWLLKHFNDVSLLNKKSEFISKCRHENKLLIKSAEKG